MANIPLLLLSGAAGALLAMLGNAFFVLWKERLQARTIAYLAFVRWYEAAHLQRASFVGYHKLLDEGQMSPELRDRVTWELIQTGYRMQDLTARPQSLPQEVAAAFGRGAYVERIEKLADAMLHSIRPIMESLDSRSDDQPTAEPWDDRLTLSRERWHKEVKPAFEELRDELLEHSSFDMAIRRTARALRDGR